MLKKIALSHPSHLVKLSLPSIITRHPQHFLHEETTVNLKEMLTKIVAKMFSDLRFSTEMCFLETLVFGPPDPTTDTYRRIE